MTQSRADAETFHRPPRSEKSKYGCIFNAWPLPRASVPSVPKRVVLVSAWSFSCLIQGELKQLSTWNVVAHFQQFRKMIWLNGSHSSCVSKPASVTYTLIRITVKMFSAVFLFELKVFIITGHGKYDIWKFHETWPLFEVMSWTPL